MKNWKYVTLTSATNNLNIFVYEICRYGIMTEHRIAISRSVYVCVYWIYWMQIHSSGAALERIYCLIHDHMMMYPYPVPVCPPVLYRPHFVVVFSASPPLVGQSPLVLQPPPPQHALTVDCLTVGSLVVACPQYISL